jgi:hypothetical protein
MNRCFGNSVEEKPLSFMRIVSNLSKPKTRSSTFLDESRIEVLNEPSGNCLKGNGPSLLGRWSRREDFNAPSVDYNSAALTLSYTGI